MYMDGHYCPVHGRDVRRTRGLKNGHCAWCWPPQPITTLDQVKDILEVEIAAAKRIGYEGTAERYQHMLDYIENLMVFEKT